MITPADGPGPDSSHSERLIALLRRALEGDAGSRNEFFEAIYPEVERITRGILRSRFSDVRQHEETGDVTQQVILKLLTYLSDGLQFLPQTPDQLFSLVRQITRRTLLDLVDKYHGSARGAEATSSANPPSTTYRERTDGICGMPGSTSPSWSSVCRKTTRS